MVRRLRVKNAAFCLVAGVMLLSAPITGAADDVDSVDWFEREVGEGVTWKYYLFEDLYGQQQSVSVLIADPSQANISVGFPYLQRSREAISTMIPDQFPEAAGGVNGTFFDVKVGGHETCLRVDNSVIPEGEPSDKGPWSWEAALVLDASGNADVVWRPEGGWQDDTSHPDIIANGPRSVVDGAIEDNTDRGGHCSNRYPRTGAGVSAAGEVVLVVVDGRTEFTSGMTCAELSRLMIDLGCVDAVNMDGGGSSAMWARGEPNDGIVSYPSDNGFYDHEGQRSVSNGIAIVAPEPSTTPAWDARLINIPRRRGMLD